MAQGKDGIWSVRKNIGFESEDQYRKIKRLAEGRGLTVGRLLVWLADGFAKYSQSETINEAEARNDPDGNPTQIHISCTVEQRERVKSLARDRGMSMSQYLLSVANPSQRNLAANDFPWGNELAILALIENHCAFGEFEQVKEQVKILRESVMSKARLEDLDSGQN
jgi:hypothetical protein